MESRRIKHNKGYSTATKSGVPWRLKKKVAFNTKTEAIKAEAWIKRMKSRKIIQEIIQDRIDLKEIIAG